MDSLKIIPLPIAAIPKAFGLPISKLDLDYAAPREIGHELDKDAKIADLERIIEEKERLIQVLLSKK